MNDDSMYILGCAVALIVVTMLICGAIALIATLLGF